MAPPSRTQTPSVTVVVDFHVEALHVQTSGKGDLFEVVRTLLRQSSLRIRRQPVNYLAYALIDDVVDQFFPVLEEYNEGLCWWRRDPMKNASRR